VPCGLRHVCLREFEHRHRQLPTHLGHGRIVFVYSVSVLPCIRTGHVIGPLPVQKDLLTRKCNTQLIRIACKKQASRQSETTDYSTAKKKKCFINLLLSSVRHYQYFVTGIVGPSSRILGVNQMTVLESVIWWGRDTRPRFIRLPV
jgi:hypothetical protein